MEPASPRLQLGRALEWKQSGSSKIKRRLSSRLVDRKESHWAPGLGLTAPGERQGWGVDSSVLQVYSIISVQLLITVAIIAIFTFV